MYGLGGENMAVGSSVVLAEWFQNKEMAFAMALQVVVALLSNRLPRMLGLFLLWDLRVLALKKCV